MVYDKSSNMQGRCVIPHAKSHYLLAQRKDRLMFCWLISGDKSKENILFNQLYAWQHNHY